MPMLAMLRLGAGCWIAGGGSIGIGLGGISFVFVFYKKLLQAPYDLVGAFYL
jgi:hypothetical protein